MDGSDAAVPGWWLASDGRWYQPEDLPAGWEIGPDGRPARAVAPAAPEEPPDASADVAMARRSFVVTTAPDVPVGASSPDASRGSRLERRWWAAVPAVAVLALVAAYVLVATGGEGGGDAQVLGLVERRTTTTSAPDRATATAADPTSTSVVSGEVTTSTAGSAAAAVVPVTSVVAGPPASAGRSSTSIRPPSTAPPGTVPGTAPPATAPPGTAPPTTAPPGTAPPTTAPPGTAPPTTAPPSTAPPTTTRRTTTIPPTSTTISTATCSAGVVDPTPRSGDDVTVHVLSSLRNAPVELTIRYRSGAVTRNGTTSILGLSSVVFDIGTQPSGYQVVVDVTVGADARCRTSFRPH